MHKSELDEIDMDGFTPLHHAVHDRNLPRLKRYLAAGANPNIQSKKPSFFMTPVLEMPFHGGSSALHLAATLGHHEMIEPLLNAGADPQLCDEKGFGPLDSAINSYNYYAQKISLRKDGRLSSKFKSFLTEITSTKDLEKERDHFTTTIRTFLKHGIKPKLLLLPAEFITTDTAPTPPPPKM